MYSTLCCSRQYARQIYLKLPSSSINLFGRTLKMANKTQSLPPIHVFVVSEAIAEALQKVLPEVEIINIPFVKENEVGFNITPDQFKQLQNAEIIASDPRLISNFMYEIPQAKWVQSISAGVDRVMKALDPNKPLPSFIFTRYSVHFGATMAEYVVGHIIARERMFIETYHKQQQAVWSQKEFMTYRPLAELTIGILGIGSIGKEIARVCKSFGMTVLGLVTKLPLQKDKSPHVDEFRITSQLSELLAASDYVCSILPSTQNTVGFLNGDCLSACKHKPTVFINVGRGDVIQEADLVKALNEKWIAGAILDVFGQEPLSSDSPLWKMPQVIITPHISALTLPKYFAEFMKESYLNFVAGKTMSWQPLWDRQY